MGAVNAVATPDRLPARGDLVGVPPAEPTVVAVHRVVGAGLGAGRDVVGGRAGAARPDQPAVPGLHRILRRHHAVDVADRGAARHRQLDAVRRAHRHRGVVAGHPAGAGAGHHAGRGRRSGRAGAAVDAGPRPAGHHAADRRRAAGRRLLRRARLTAGACGAAVPRCRRRPAAQRAQARTGDPHPAGARAGASARPDPAAGQRAAAGVDPRLRPPRERQAGGGRASWC